MQLPIHIIMSKSFILSSINQSIYFLMRSVYTRSFEHVNTVGLRLPWTKLEEQRSVDLLLENEKPCHILQRLQKTFSEARISRSTFYSWVSQFRERRTSVWDKPRPRRLDEAVTPTLVANVEMFVNKDRRVTLQLFSLTLVKRQHFRYYTNN